MEHKFVTMNKTLKARQQQKSWVEKEKNTSGKNNVLEASNYYKWV